MIMRIYEPMMRLMNKRASEHCDRRLMVKKDWQGNYIARRVTLPNRSSILYLTVQSGCIAVVTTKSVKPCQIPSKSSHQER